MFKFGSKEVSFFDLFVESAQATHSAAKKLEALTSNYTNIAAQVQAIEEIEHECDQHVHKILAQLNKSFITPIDREDIFLVAKEIDNITDAIESTAHRFIMLNVTEIREEAKILVSLIVQSTRELEDVMDGMRNMKFNSDLKKKIIEVNRIEDEADDIFRKAITDLFASEPNAVEIIKWKEIFEYLENTLDACEDVANIVEGIVMKNS
jgi:predicted phosphate transport protein (TIGR00153 family)